MSAWRLCEQRIAVTEPAGTGHAARVSALVAAYRDTHDITADDEDELLAALADDTRVHIPDESQADLARRHRRGVQHADKQYIDEQITRVLTERSLCAVGHDAEPALRWLPRRAHDQGRPVVVARAHARRSREQAHEEGHPRPRGHVTGPGWFLDRPVEPTTSCRSPTVPVRDLVRPRFMENRPSSG